MNPGSTSTVETLYDFEQSFSVPGAFQGLKVAEEFFGGNPIPLALGPGDLDLVRDAGALPRHAGGVRQSPRWAS